MAGKLDRPRTKQHSATNPYLSVQNRDTKPEKVWTLQESTEKTQFTVEERQRNICSKNTPEIRIQ